MDHAASPAPPPPQSKTGLVHVQHPRAVTAALRAAGHRYGGGGVPGASAVVAAWTAFDAGLGGAAHRHFLLVGTTGAVHTSLASTVDGYREDMARTRKELEPLHAEADRRATVLREPITPLPAAPPHAA